MDEDKKIKGFKNKNILVIVFEILVIVLGIGGITFATSKLLNDRTQTLITGGEYNVEYVGDEDISFDGLEPISDEYIDINTKDNVIRLEFSLRGVSTNKEEDLIYDVMLSNMEIDCSLLNEYTKWNLYKNGKLLSSGNLSPEFDGSILEDNYRLTTIQEDLPKYNEDYDKYTLIMWISESCDDLTTCTLIDQSNIANSKMKMKVFIALYGGAKKEYTRVANYDTSCANRPILYDNMVPIVYSNGSWVVADRENSNKDNLWYDYNNQKWANAVVVKNNIYTTVGMKINSEDILAYYVWIPRYRYKLWNAVDLVDDSYNAYDNGIDIIFENKLNSTVIANKYSNDMYITHPVFGNDLTGFWINKYEISKNNDNYLSIPLVEGYANDTLVNYQNITSSLSSSYNLGDKVESHIVNNLEWGATLYLSHSKYGVCSIDGCSSISVNSSYITGDDKQDTTTRNVYGVYDMAGSLSEYVYGNYNIGSATKEVILSDGNTWYNGNSIMSNRDYIIRGGKDKALFYFGDISMGSPMIGTRSVLIEK